MPGAVNAARKNPATRGLNGSSQISTVECGTQMHLPVRAFPLRALRGFFRCRTGKRLLGFARRLVADDRADRAGLVYRAFTTANGNGDGADGRHRVLSCIPVSIRLSALNGRTASPIKSPAEAGFFIWWRWGELNPRPKARYFQHYMLSPLFNLVGRQHNVRGTPANIPALFSL